MKGFLKFITVVLLLLAIISAGLCFLTLNGSEISSYRNRMYEASDEIDEVNELIDELESKYGSYARDEVDLLEMTKDVHFDTIDLCLEKINACYTKAKIYGVLSGVLFIGFIIMIIVCRKKAKE